MSHYVAPEMYEEVHYDINIDVFSFRLVLCEVLVGEAVGSRDLRLQQVMKKALTGPSAPIPGWTRPFVRDRTEQCRSRDPGAANLPRNPHSPERFLDVP
jgi:hypothetical protein